MAQQWEIEAGMQLRLGDRVGGKYRTGLQSSCFSHPQLRADVDWPVTKLGPLALLGRDVVVPNNQTLFTRHACRIDWGSQVSYLAQIKL